VNRPGWLLDVDGILNVSRPRAAQRPARDGSVVAFYSSGSQAISWSKTRRSPSSRSESIRMRP
jgi:hypothetical protein